MYLQVQAWLIIISLAIYCKEGGGFWCITSRGDTLSLSLAIFFSLKKTPFLLQCFGEKHAVFLTTFAKMYPFMNKIAEKWRAALKIFKNCL